MKVIYFNKKIYELKSLDLDELSLHRLTVCDVCDLDSECRGDYSICKILESKFRYSLPPNLVISEIHLFELIKKFMS